MPDISQETGSDIASGPTGDLLPVSGTLLGQQRVIRRLFTNPGSYIWHPTYGAGLPSYIGLPMTQAQIQGLVQQQMLLEEAVAQNPLPTCAVSFYGDGTFNVSITYADALTGQSLLLQFDVNS